MIPRCTIVFCMPLIGGVPFFLCDVVCLSVSLVCFECAALLLCCRLFVFGVYVLFVVCCVAVCCFVGLSCVYGLIVAVLVSFCLLLWFE